MQPLTLDALAAMAPHRNKNRGPAYQNKLRAYADAMAKVYGYRPEPPPPGRGLRVPYVPMPTAGQMVVWIRAEALRLLTPPLTFSLSEAAYRWVTDATDDAKQPGFIRRYLDAAESIVGKVNAKGEVVEPNPRSFQVAPPEVVARALRHFGIKSPVRHPQVLTAPATYAFIDAIQRLAIHFDNLAGSPSRISIGAESVGEAWDELPATLLGVLDAPRKAATEAATSALKWAGIGLLGLGALWVVSR